MVIELLHQFWQKSSGLGLVKNLGERIRAKPGVASAVLLGSVGSAVAAVVGYSALTRSVTVGEWRSLGEAFSGSELQQWQERLIRDNYAPAAASVSERSAIKIKKIVAPQTLYWVDFNNRSELCGVRGCLYAVYSEAGERLLAVYLQPVQENFLEARKGAEGFPSLIVRQPGRDATIERIQFVYHGDRYLPVNRERIQLKGGSK
jgi:hypothetical protein